jgi:hypothetical protein
MQIRPAVRSGGHGGFFAKAARIPLVANAATIRNMPNEVIVTSSEAVMPRMIVRKRSAPAAY